MHYFSEWLQDSVKKILNSKSNGHIFFTNDVLPRLQQNSTFFKQKLKEMTTFSIVVTRSGVDLFFRFVQLQMLTIYSECVFVTCSLCSVVSFIPFTFYSLRKSDGRNIYLG